MLLFLEHPYKEAESRAMTFLTAKVTVFTSRVWCVHVRAISIARDPVKHELTKHIGVDASFVRAGVED